MLTTALIGLAATTAMMTLVWVASLVQKDASLVDRVWGMAFVVYAWTYLLVGDAPGPRGLLVAVLVTIWGVRLSGYITWRNWGHGEDKRYAAMRRKRPESFPLRSLVTIFWFQGLLAWLISLPLLAVATADGPEALIWLDWLGVAVWAIGFYFEAVGDWQLTRFLADPANDGHVMNQGLWRYTRHPNYFGDATLWWGYFLFALATGAWWSAIGSLTMGLFIVKVSGVALTDKVMAKKSSKRIGYDDYVARTNAFFPGPPKKTPELSEG